MHRLGAFPQLEPFVKGDKKGRFAALEHQDLRGQMPRLLLVGDDGEVAEELNIESWDTDTVEEFLVERLVDSSPVPAATEEE